MRACRVPAGTALRFPHLALPAHFSESLSHTVYTWLFHLLACVPRAPRLPVSDNTGMTSPQNYLHKGGRKLNAEYYVIKAHRAMEGQFAPPSTPVDSVSYVAFCVKTTREVAVTLSGEELSQILGADRCAALFSDVQAERQAAHQAVIDSLQFEDKMLTSQSQTQVVAAPPPQPVFDGPVSPRVTSGDVPVPAPVVARIGRKVNGKHRGASVCV